MKVEYSATHTYVSTTSRDLDPRDFINCNSWNEVETRIAEKLEELPYDRLEYVDTIGDDVIVSDEFYDTWISLKGLNGTV